MAAVSKSSRRFFERAGLRLRLPELAPVFALGDTSVAPPTVPPPVPAAAVRPEPDEGAVTDWPLQPST
jgi:hypothetical protein